MVSGSPTLGNIVRLDERLLKGAFRFSALL